ncbi:hypothetical protein GTO89_15550 [Heliobacterium gestii]|uniref:Uncharacterized protein n=1 Tax=Heliomicrobium gestii TaxID=2699 RepID=A0A845LC99_HELGE|nr:hypothetical protein [Heliomicrobium gestii]MBM7868253.1 hypothetical protein [Heliomicrobium gestii]MZP44447.1 hypothetical protein [Heliomicrobium gestii]
MISRGEVARKQAEAHWSLGKREKMLLAWKQELEAQIATLRERRTELLNQRDYLALKIECFDNWNLENCLMLKNDYIKHYYDLDAEIFKIEAEILFHEEILDKVFAESRRS